MIKAFVENGRSQPRYCTITGRGLWRYLESARAPKIHITNRLPL